MKILLIGNSHFSDKLAAGLSDYQVENTYVSVHTDGGFFDKLKYLFSLAGGDVVYLLGGEICSSKAVELALLFNKKVVMHWIGSDVLSAFEKFRQGRVNQRYVKEVRHFCEAPWIQEELGQVGLHADVVHIAAMSDAARKVAPIPNKFSILTYVGRGSEKFYGMDLLIRLAKDFPDVPIKVAGISEYSEVLPPSMQLLGWVNDMSARYDDCVLYLRLPSHDGLAFSVIEALSAGRYVGYTRRFNNTIFVDGYETLKVMVSDLKARHELGGLQANKDGADFVVREFNSAKIYGALDRNLTR